MDTNALAGIIPIPVTTFTADGALDLEGLRRQVRFCLDIGADAVLYPGVVSEFYTLTDRERAEAVQACAAEVGTRAPFVVGVSAASTAASAMFAAHAAEVGASAVMTMVPFVQHFFSPSADLELEHVQAVAAAAEAPVILQNARIGHPMSTATISRIVDAVPNVRYVKQETNPATQDLTDLLEVLKDRLVGAFGGIGGVYLVNELDRGALGSMPSPAFADRIVDAYRAYRADGSAAAQDVLNPLGSLFTRELLYNVIFIKEVLRRRGIISGTTVRVASPTLDGVDLDELDRMMTQAELF